MNCAKAFYTLFSLLKNEKKRLAALEKLFIKEQ